jgi:ethanolamine utilization protein EutA
LKRTNARAIADLFADQSGKFVCASAGHHLEALMAAHGSGAVDLSRVQHKTFLNVDIGGGTTKFAILHGGQLLDSAAVAVGGRLIAFDNAGRMIRIEDPVRKVADDIGVHLELGAVLAPESRAALVARLVEILVRAIRLETADSLTGKLLVTDPLRRGERIDAITFSGGVSEYIYGRETKDHGDLGRDLARGITGALAKKRISYPVSDPGQGIRATAVGASQFTVQVSGNTIYVSDPKALPIRNLPVLTLTNSLDGTINPIAIRDQIIRALVRFDIDETETTVALAFKWGGDPTHARLHALASGICLGLSDATTKGRPIVLVTEGDISNNLGQLLANELDVKGTIISLDGLQLHEFDYVDIGELSQPANIVPVVIKSLLFAAADRSVQDHHHDHDHGSASHTHDHAHGTHHHPHD